MTPADVRWLKQTARAGLRFIAQFVRQEGMVLQCA